MTGLERRVAEFVAAAIAAGAALGGGCGFGGPTVLRDGLDLVAVAGTVTCDGAALPDVEVRLVAPDGTFAVGRTDAAGCYEMWFDSVTPGATGGRKRVVVLPAGGGEDGDPAMMADSRATLRLESAACVEITGPVADLEIRVARAPGD